MFTLRSTATTLILRMVHVRVTSIKGFTLLELLIVISLIGVIAAWLLAVLNPMEQISKANDAKRKTDLSVVQKAIEQYYQDNGSYPPSSNGRIQFNSQDLIWGSSAFGTYLQRLPQDGTSGKTYAYFSTPSGDSFWLFASLDRGGTDPQACNPDGSAEGGACLKAVNNSVSCLQTCNYGISSPNVSPN